MAAGYRAAGGGSTHSGDPAPRGEGGLRHRVGGSNFSFSPDPHPSSADGNFIPAATTTCHPSSQETMYLLGVVIVTSSSDPLRCNGSSASPIIWVQHSYNISVSFATIIFLFLQELGELLVRQLCQIDTLKWSAIQVADLKLCAKAPINLGHKRRGVDVTCNGFI